MSNKEYGENGADDQTCSEIPPTLAVIIKEEYENKEFKQECQEGEEDLLETNCKNSTSSQADITQLNTNNEPTSEYLNTIRSMATEGVPVGAVPNNNIAMINSSSAIMTEGTCMQKQDHDTKIKGNGKGLTENSMCISGSQIKKENQFQVPDYLITKEGKIVKLKIQRQTEKSSGSKMVVCHICGRSFYKMHYLNLHKKIHERIINFRCNVCDKHFLCRSHLKEHSSIHSSDKTYVCNVCGKGFKRSSHLNTHRIVHETVKMFECDVCHLCFGSKSRLQMHVKYHDDTLRYVCTICGKSYKQKNTLNVHYRAHKGIKRYACEVCQKRFNVKTHLTHHMLTHTKVKKFMCDRCGKTFGLKRCLEVHMNIHDGIRNYICNVCDRAFTQQTALLNHSVIHTGIKKFECDSCGKFFLFTWYSYKTFGCTLRV